MAGGTGVHLKKRLLLSGSITLTLLLIAAALLAGFNSLLLPVNADAGDQLVVINIPGGASSSQIGQILADHGIIQSPLAFRLYVRWHDLDRGFIAGDYQLSPAMSIKEITAMMTQGDVYRQTDWFVIIEGHTVRQIADSLVRAGLAERERFLELVSSPPPGLLEEHGFLHEIPAGVDFTLEGYLFPDTYEITRDASEEEIISLSLRRLRQIFNEQLQERARQAGMNLHQVLTLASIVEREAAVDHERERIAAVFLNRLARDYPLQSCATVQYLLDEVKPVLTIAELAIDSPYNTYLYPGLPPGPIAAPGESSIRAVLYPEETGYMYFVSKMDGSGEHYFARTLREHEANRIRAEKRQ